MHSFVQILCINNLILSFSFIIIFIGFWANKMREWTRTSAYVIVYTNEYVPQITLIIKNEWIEAPRFNEIAYFISLRVEIDNKIEDIYQ